MQSPATLSEVAVGALTLGALGLGIAQKALGRINKNGKTVGQLSVEQLDQRIAMVVTQSMTERIIPVLNELRVALERQVEIQQKQIEILVELVTVSRIGRR